MFINPLKPRIIKPNCIFPLTKCFASLCSNTSIANIDFPDEDTKMLKVSIIGVPNSGKSTFINQLMDRKVCPTSSKVHTTKTKSMAIFTQGDSQIVFLDTPGLVNANEKKKFNLTSSFIKDSRFALQKADIIGVVHDAANIHTREKLDIKIINLLEGHKKTPSFLVLNKIDVLKSKRKLLDITRLLTDNCLAGKPIPGHSNKPKDPNHEFKGWPYFQDIFMVSALTGDGLDQVRNYLTTKAKPAKWMFPENVWTDQSAEEVIQNSVRAKLLDFLPQEIPYILQTEIEFFDVNEEGVINAVVIVKTPSSRISTLVAGGGGGRLKQILQSVKEDLQNAFQNYVKINIVLEPPANTIN
ncbi:unnamed protein product [Ceutorhynchus assimilis]|uniref:GTPase Era, mitochondrial n=1 Tax=Ceutorhynchus assimilis TaxID=467358 RepID=A0A9N9N028_9CUCU|nr:unnamed protein product [Ceutorhynchus assimilis]